MRFSIRPLPIAAAALILAAGCTYTPPPDAPIEPPRDQPSRGESLYAQSCAGCHGENGDGTEGRPPLVGPKAMPVDPPATASRRKAPLRTAKDLFAFIKSDMPPIDPGTLSDEQTWAVVAFLLKSNGVAVTGELRAANASATPIHR
jgi:S-disulfanyl-L-cysteine oxidoreductase SoxD